MVGRYAVGAGDDACPRQVNFRQRFDFQIACKWRCTESQTPQSGTLCRIRSREVERDVETAHEGLVDIVAQICRDNRQPAPGYSAGLLDHLFLNVSGRRDRLDERSGDWQAVGLALFVLAFTLIWVEPVWGGVLLVGSAIALIAPQFLER